MSGNTVIDMGKKNVNDPLTGHSSNSYEQRANSPGDDKLIFEQRVSDGGAFGLASVLVEDFLVRSIAAFAAQREGENVMTRRGEDDQLKRSLLETETGDCVRTLVYDLTGRRSQGITVRWWWGGVGSERELAKDLSQLISPFNHKVQRRTFGFE